MWLAAFSKLFLAWLQSLLGRSSDGMLLPLIWFASPRIPRGRRAARRIALMVGFQGASAGTGPVGLADRTDAAISASQRTFLPACCSSQG